MTTSITARHCEISDELRQRAEAVLTRLSAMLASPVDGTVVFDVAPAASTAEIRLRGGKGESLNATGEDRDHRSALDRAEEKIRRQLDKVVPTKRGRGAKDVA
jgi:ribosomal subunit interface protein